MQCELSAEARDVLSMLAYQNWSEAFDTLKWCKEQDIETPANIKIAGSIEDFRAMKAERLKNAQAAFDKAQRVLDEIKEYSPLVIAERERMKK